MPIKKSDSRYETFCELHPDLEGSYELDAFDPDELQRITEEAIDDFFDPSLLRKDAMEEWQEKFKDIKEDILRKLKE